MSVDLRRLSIADQLNTALREICEEHGYEVLVLDTGDPARTTVGLKPHPGVKKIAEFARMAAERAGVKCAPRVYKHDE